MRLQTLFPSHGYLPIETSHESEMMDELHLEILKQLGQSLQTQKDLDSSIANKIGPLISTPEAPISHLVSRTLKNHHQDYTLVCQNGEELPVSSVLFSRQARGFIPLASRRHSVPLAKAGVQGLMRLWAGDSLTTLFQEDPTAHFLAPLIKAAEYFGRSDLIQAKEVLASAKKAIPNIRCIGSTQIGNHFNLYPYLYSFIPYPSVILNMARIACAIGLTPVIHLPLCTKTILQSYLKLVEEDKEGLIYSLKVLAIGKELVPGLALHITKQGYLKSLSLDCARVNTSSLAGLLEAVKACNGLTSLELFNIPWEPEVVESLAEMMGTHPTIARYTLGRDKDEERDKSVITTESLEKIGTEMTGNSKIKSLSLLDLDLEPKCLASLLAAIQTHPSLENLDLTGNGVTGPAATALNGLLQKTSHLRALVLTECGMKPKDIATVARGLALNRGLHELELTDSTLGLEGAKALGSALSIHPSLRQLNLSRNGLNYDEAELLSKGLRPNQNLRQLNLSDNDLGNEGALCIGQALARHPRIRKVLIRGNGVTDQGMSAFSNLLRRLPLTKLLNQSGPLVLSRSLPS